MLLESWSIALITCAAVTLIFGGIGAAVALQVLRFWDLGSDSERQIRLEQRLWLAATLVQFGLVVQVVSALLFVYAADHFATMLSGAMCAAGALSANAYGLPALACKLGAIILGSLWIVLHRLDIGAEDFPLTRLKCLWLLLLLPLLAADAVLVVRYLAGLEPDTLTSCCGVLFGGGDAGGYSLFARLSGATLLLPAALSALLLGPGTWLALGGAGSGRPGPRLAGAWLLAGGWSTFYPLALLAITVVVSPYVYALPQHRCPFDLLQLPYAPIGLPLYLSLHGAVVSGLAGALAGVVSGSMAPERRPHRFIRRCSRLSLILLLLFLAVAAYKPLLYILLGGQR